MMIYPCMTCRRRGWSAVITPVFAFDRHERWYPVGVDDSVARYGYLVE
jgi:hypothetical protein